MKTEQITTWCEDHLQGYYYPAYKGCLTIQSNKERLYGKPKGKSIYFLRLLPKDHYFQKALRNAEDS